MTPTEKINHKKKHHHPFATPIAATTSRPKYMTPCPYGLMLARVERFSLPVKAGPEGQKTVSSPSP